MISISLPDDEVRKSTESFLPWPECYREQWIPLPFVPSPGLGEIRTQLKTPSLFGAPIELAGWVCDKPLWLCVEPIDLAIQSRDSVSAVGTWFSNGMLTLWRVQKI